MQLLDLCNRFLHFKRGLVTEGTLTTRSWSDYHSCCERVMEVFGETRVVEDLRPDDFETLRRDYATTWGVVRIGNEINRVRVLLRYTFEAQLIDAPVRFGSAFKRPSRKCSGSPAPSKASACSSRQKSTPSSPLLHLP